MQTLSNIVSRQNWSDYRIWVAPQKIGNSDARQCAQENFSHVLFRRNFVYEQNAPKVYACLFADTLWKLYINGKPVLYGYARAPKGMAIIEGLDITGYLKNGKNVVAVEVLYANYPGDLMPQKPGLICLIKGIHGDHDGMDLVSNEGWKALNCRSYDYDGPAFCVSRRHPVEIIDASMIPAGWEKPDFDDSGWDSARRIKNDEGIQYEIRETRDGVNRVVPDSVIQMGTRNGKINEDRWRSDWSRLRPGHADASTSVPLEDSKRLGDIVQTEDCLPITSGIENAEALIVHGKGNLVLSPEKGLSPYVVYDLGKVYAGLIGIEASGPPGANIEVSWAENLDRMTGEFRPQTIHVGNPVMRIRLSGGNDKVESMYVHSMRYLCLAARGDSADKVHIGNLYLRLYQAVPNGSGAFICSDSKLNRIYNSSLDTLCANMADLYMDCPDRERGAYYGEAYGGMGRMAFYALGDLSIVRTMCRLTARTQGFQPEVPGMISTIIGSNSPDHEWYFATGGFDYILLVLMYTELSGDDSLMRELSPVIQKIIKQYEEYLNDEGVLEAVPSRMAWVDWSTTDTVEGGVSLGLNCRYLKALEEMYKFTGELAYREKALKLRKVLNSLAPFDMGPSTEVSCFYPDGYRRTEDKKKLEKVYSLSETMQYNVLWSGLPEPKRAESIWRHLRHTCAPFPDRKESEVAVFMKRGGSYSFLLRLLFAVKNGDFDIAFRDLRQMGYYMASREPGTLWEQYFESSFSLCHGIMSWMGAFIVENCLGVRPGVKGGFSRMVIEPHGDRELTWANGYITTRQGRVSVSWHLGDLEYTLNVGLPENTTADVILPPEAGKVWKKGDNGGSKWNESIFITTPAKIRVTPGNIEITEF
jgi:alpha-L-rhamnosidase